MRIMSLDASSKSTGVAIFEDKNLIYYECITASSSDNIKRIQKIVNRIDVLLTEYPVDKIIMEEVIPKQGQRIQIHRVLMWVQAAIAFMIHDNHSKVSIEYVVASSWRAKCEIKTGRSIRRESLKPADIKFVKDTYNLDVNDDIADAIGIGHAYVNQLKDEINWE